MARLAGRTYRARAGASLVTGEWAVVFDPTEATNGQTYMHYTDQTATGMVQRFYMVDVLIP